jgi:hypothetical protein
VVSASIASPALSTNSSVLVVTTGLPASAAFSMATGTGSSGNACPNVEAYNIDGVTIPIVVRLADRYNNPAPDGTAVAFTTDGGHVVGNCVTPSTSANTGDGTCSATWTSANPRPQLADDNPALKANGRVTILATAIGEESFTDTNGDGYYDDNEPFTSLGEPYRDDNENNQYDLGEYFLDFNGNGVRDPAPAETPANFVGITCTTTGCSTKTLAISTFSRLIMSTSDAQITLISGGGPYTVNSNNPIEFNVQDLNGNPMAAGTTVTVSASAPLGTISQGTFTIPCSTELGGETYTAFLAGASTPGVGNVTITVVSPSGATTVLNDSTSVN